MHPIYFLELRPVLLFKSLFILFHMKSTYVSRQDYPHSGSSSADYAALAAGRDFTTLDGRIVPRALGEIALRQRTALLIGGLLVGEWPEQA